MAQQGNQNGQAMSNTTGSVKNAAKLAKDIGRLFAGDMSAIKDLLMNKLLWEILLFGFLFIALIGLILTSALTGVIEFIADCWAENWAENWEDQAIESEGSQDYLRTDGWLLTLLYTAADTIVDAYNEVKQIGLSTGSGTIDNSQIDDQEVQDAGRNPQASDFDNTLKSISDNIALNQALIDRLDMIKGRVRQRGIQIKKAAIKQYLAAPESQYRNIIDDLMTKIEPFYETEDGKYVLYAGYNNQKAKENMNFDISVFELTDLQALKILAIFSIQHDCQLTDMDMWTLMDYCGWFRSDLQGELFDTADTIYETVLQTQSYGSDIGDVIHAGEAIPLATYEFPTLKVPVWVGSCAPQWYFEQISQIRQHNDKLGASAPTEGLNSESILWGYAPNVQHEVYLNTFVALWDQQTFGIVDRLFYSAENHLTINRSEYSSGADIPLAYIEELGNDIYKFWIDYVMERTQNTINGCITRISMADAKNPGGHVYYYHGSIPETITETFTNPETGDITELKTFYVLELSSEASGRIWTKLYLDNDDLIFTELSGATLYELNLRKITTKTEYDTNGNMLSSTSVTETEEQIVDYFTTFEDGRETIAYQLYAGVDLSFKVRTIEDIAFDLLGIWPGDLTDVTEVIYKTSSGNLLGCSEENGEKSYSLCLVGGYHQQIDKIGNGVGVLEGSFQNLKRPHSQYVDDEQPKIVTDIYEYGVSSTPLVSVNDTPSSGWRQVTADGKRLLFEVEPNTPYYAYVRLTRIRKTIGSDGNISETSMQILYTIDYLPSYASSFFFDNGEQYAAAHLGNTNLRPSWTDQLIDTAGNVHTIQFERLTGYQYETYIDLVMALCELLDVSYDGWEPGLERAEELGIRSKGGDGS